MIPACSLYLRPACSPTSWPTALVAAMPQKSPNLSTAPPSSLSSHPKLLCCPLSLENVLPNRGHAVMSLKNQPGNVTSWEPCLGPCTVLGLCPDCGWRGRFGPRRQAPCIFLPESAIGFIVVARGGVVGRSWEGRRRRWCCPASIFAKRCCCCGIWLFGRCRGSVRDLSPSAARASFMCVTTACWRRYKKRLDRDPMDVDALCGYACYLTTVKSNDEM